MSAAATAPSRASAPRLGKPELSRSEARRRRLPLMPALVFVFIVTQVPFLVTIVLSLQSWNLVRPGSQEFVGLSNYADVVVDSEFRGALGHSVLLTLLSVAIAMVLGIALAMLLDRKFLGRGLLRTLLISPFLVMPAAAALLWKTTMLDPTYGVVNWFLGLFGSDGIDFVTQHPLGSVVAVLVWQWTPFMMLIVLAGLQSQPRDVLEAARMDGASAWSSFREITIPHLRSYIELGVVLGAIYLVNTFDAIYMMTQGGPGTASTNLPYYLFQRAFQGFDVGQAAALGVVTVVGTIVVATIALRVVFRLFTESEARA